MYKVLHALNIPIHVQEVGLVGLRGGTPAGSRHASRLRYAFNWAQPQPCCSSQGLSQTVAWRPHGPGALQLPGSCATRRLVCMLRPRPHHTLSHVLLRPQVCVFTAPVFSALCALATYGLVSECR